jgi:hypothetical protein
MNKDLMREIGDGKKDCTNCSRNFGNEWVGSFLLPNCVVRSVNKIGSTEYAENCIIYEPKEVAA